ncbi:hypothetical protein P5V15_015292 [Pogonomyrmex californicus]
MLRLDPLNPANYHRRSDSAQNVENADMSTSEVNENEAAIRWLKISREPWIDVLKNWDITYDIRQKTLDIRQKTLDIRQKTIRFRRRLKPTTFDYGLLFSMGSFVFASRIYSCKSFDFTILKFIYLSANTNKLHDFNKKYPDKDLTLFLEWERFISLFKQLLKAEVKDSYGKIQLKKLEKLDDVMKNFVNFFVFNAYDNIFVGLHSDYERLEALKESEFYIASTSYVIGSHYRPRREENKILCQDTGQYIFIKEILKYFLELPGCFNAITSNLEHLFEKDDPFSNVVQGEMWKEKIAKHFYGKIILSVIFFFDDMDPNNITGSHWWLVITN